MKRRRVGEMYMVERPNGTSKKKEVIFKIIKEKDAEYIKDVDDEQLEVDSFSSASESKSHSSQVTQSTCHSDESAVRREVKADPRQYKKIYKRC